MTPNPTQVIMEIAGFGFYLMGFLIALIPVDAENANLIGGSVVFCWCLGISLIQTSAHLP